MLSKMTPSQIEDDIKKNKVKQGMVVKQSRFLKQWKQRWMVLTKTHFYSFDKKGVYKDPTQIIPLEKTLTIKSYYKMQYDKPHIFRIQTPDIHLYLSPKTSQQKWAWMTAIQKMLNRVFVPQQKTDSHAMIRQTLRMTSTMRQTMTNNRISSQNQKDKLIEKQQIGNVLDKLKLGLTSQIINIALQPAIKKQQNPSLNKQIKVQQQPIKIQKVQIQVQKIVQKQKIVEKERIVQVPVEKVVYVPQIRQKIIQKIIYKDANSSQNKNYLQTIFKDLIQSKVKNPKPMIDFIVFLLCSRLQKYTTTIISFLMSSQIQRFFAEIFLHLLNQCTYFNKSETNEQQLNSYFQFMTYLYDNCQQYFYSSDVRVLIDIILKQMQLNRSEFNQFLIMTFVKKLSTKNWWKKQTHRRNQLKMMVKQLESISNSQNQILAKQILSVL